MQSSGRSKWDNRRSAESRCFPRRAQASAPSSRFSSSPTADRTAAWFRRFRARRGQGPPGSPCTPWHSAGQMGPGRDHSVIAAEIERLTRPRCGRSRERRVARSLRHERRNRSRQRTQGSAPVSAARPERPKSRTAFSRAPPVFSSSRSSYPRDGPLVCRELRRLNRLYSYPGQIIEARSVRCDHRPPSGERRRRDDQIVRSPRSTRPADMGEHSSMCSSHLRVVGLARDRREHLRHILLARLASPPIREFDAQQQFRNRDRGHCHIVVVTNQLFERNAVPLCVDQNRRVKNQSLQGRSSIWSAARIRLSSSTQAASRGAARNTSFTAAPRPASAGPIRATARPRRTTMNVSPRDSTASSTSAKFRAASVAVTLRIKSDYRIVSEVVVNW